MNTEASRRLPRGAAPIGEFSEIRGRPKPKQSLVQRPPPTSTFSEPRKRQETQFNPLHTKSNADKFYTKRTDGTPPGAKEKSRRPSQKKVEALRALRIHTAAKAAARKYGNRQHKEKYRQHSGVPTIVIRDPNKISSAIAGARIGGAPAPPLTPSEVVVAGWLKHDLGLSHRHISMLRSANPTLLEKLDSSPVGREAVKWLKDKVELEKEDAQRAVLRFPQLLLTNVESLDASLSWLESKFGLAGRPGGLKGFVKKSPWLVAFDSDVLSTKTNLLEECFDLQKDQQGLAKLVENLPSMVWTAQSGWNPQEVVESWAKALNVTNDDAAKMLLVRPALFAYSDVPTVISPKMDLFIKVMGGEQSAVSATLVESPRLLSTGLERLRTRCRTLKQAGVQVEFARHVFKISMDSEAQFDKYVERVRVNDRPMESAEVVDNAPE